MNRVKLTVYRYCQNERHILCQPPTILKLSKFNATWKFIPQLSKHPTNVITCI